MMSILGFDAKYLNETFQLIDIQLEFIEFNDTNVTFKVYSSDPMTPVTYLSKIFYHFFVFNLDYYVTNPTNTKYSLYTFNYQSTQRNNFIQFQNVTGRRHQQFTPTFGFRYYKSALFFLFVYDYVPCDNSC